MSDLMIRRWRHVLILVLVVVIPAGVLWARYEWDCRKKRRSFEQRVQQVRRQADELKLHATKRDAEEFFRRVGVEHFSSQEFSGDSGLIMEVLDGSLIVQTCGSFVCDDEAVIRITVTLDANGNVTAKDVRTWRTCL